MNEEERFQKWRTTFSADLPADDAICRAIYLEFTKGKVKSGVEILKREMTSK